MYSIVVEEELHYFLMVVIMLFVWLRPRCVVSTRKNNSIFWRWMPSWNKNNWKAIGIRIP